MQLSLLQRSAEGGEGGGPSGQAFSAQRFYLIARARWRDLVGSITFFQEKMKLIFQTQNAFFQQTIFFWGGNSSRKGSVSFLLEQKIEWRSTSSGRRRSKEPSSSRRRRSYPRRVVLLGVRSPSSGRGKYPSPGRQSADPGRPHKRLQSKVTEGMHREGGEAGSGGWWRGATITTTQAWKLHV